jgi:catalase
MLAMAGYGIPRSYRHMDGWGVHTFRFVTADGSTKLVRYTWRSMQGKAAYLWEEAQVAGGKNSDTHRQDLFNTIEAGMYPEWELGVQIVDEVSQLAYGFDLLDDTKILPPEVVPITWLGKMTLNRNPQNYFAETEQVSFMPSNVVRGIDFSNDPVLQARLYSYMDTQLNRFNGPNFNQAPTNRPRNGMPHNNNRDGYSQGYIHTNVAAYKPNVVGGNFPAEANQTNGDGFFTAPNRSVTGMLTRAVSSTFNNFYMQPNMVWGSLDAAEQQILVNSLRFEMSHLTMDVVKQNFINQLNYVSHDLALRVAQVLEGVNVPPEVTTYYTNFTTSLVPIFRNPLPTIRGLTVGILASVHDAASMAQAAQLAHEFTKLGVFANVVAETLVAGVSLTYSAADASFFDGIVVAQGAESIFSANSSSPLYPLHRPAQIIRSGFNWGKPIAAVGSAVSVLTCSDISTLSAGVYADNSLSAIVAGLEKGLYTFKFLDRFPLDPPATG